MRRRPTVGIAAVVSVALVAQVALAGGGDPEGTIPITRGELKQLIRAEVTKHATASAGKKKKGRRGPPGPQGPAGRQGAPGPQGSPGASAFSSRERNNNLASATFFAPISGIGPADNTNENAVAMVSPATTIIARDLFARYADDIGSGARSFTLRVEGADSSLSCTYTFPAETSCSNTTSAVTIAPGSLLAISFNQGAGLGSSGNIEVGFRATTP